MAQRVLRVLVDDLDGSDASETVTFALDGDTYEIDLAAKNSAVFRAELAPWISAGRKVAGKVTRGTARKPIDAEVAQIRDWARANGYTVSDRGRIAADIQAAYRRANS